LTRPAASQFLPVIQPRGSDQTVYYLIIRDTNNYQHLWPCCWGL